MTNINANLAVLIRQLSLAFICWTTKTKSHFYTLFYPWSIPTQFQHAQFFLSCRAGKGAKPHKDSLPHDKKPANTFMLFMKQQWPSAEPEIRGGCINVDKSERVFCVPGSLTNMINQFSIAGLVKSHIITLTFPFIYTVQTKLQRIF